MSNTKEITQEQENLIQQFCADSFYQSSVRRGMKEVILNPSRYGLSPAKDEVKIVDFLPILQENYQAQIAGYYNDDKTDEERKIRNAVIVEYQDLIAIYKAKVAATPSSTVASDEGIKEAFVEVLRKEFRGKLFDTSYDRIAGNLIAALTARNSVINPDQNYNKPAQPKQQGEEVKENYCYQYNEGQKDERCDSPCGDGECYYHPKRFEKSTHPTGKQGQQQ